MHEVRENWWGNKYCYTFVVKIVTGGLCIVLCRTGRIGGVALWTEFAKARVKKDVSVLCTLKRKSIVEDKFFILLSKEISARMAFREGGERFLEGAERRRSENEYNRRGAV